MSTTKREDRHDRPRRK